jgi:hypothetical protein
VYCATPAVVHRAAPAALKKEVQYCEPLARTPSRQETYPRREKKQDNAEPPKG